MLIDLRNKGDVSGKKAERVLGEAHITVNKNMVPFDDRSPFITSGIRVGTAALTTRGMNEEHMRLIVDWMDQLISDSDNEALQAKIGAQVRELASGFPLFAEHVLQGAGSKDGAAAPSPAAGA
jgi:glycine hydroxymethyltransferase